jgi:SAM-dependent methyltransferase
VVRKGEEGEAEGPVGPEGAAKAYDRAYFDHWYRGEGFGSPARLDRKVAYALGSAEYLLERPVRTVLDVGCGEGVWQPALRKRRPGLRYVGVDPSEYTVARYGPSRGLRLGGVGQLGQLGLVGPFDLVVCVDVVAYVPAAELRRGLRALGELLGGVALIELFAAGDDFEGDRVGFHHGTPATYRRWFDQAGLAQVGPSLFVPADLAARLPAFHGGSPR